MEVFYSIHIDSSSEYFHCLKQKETDQLLRQSKNQISITFYDAWEWQQMEAIALDLRPL